jgi:hypothetical protein
MAVECSRELIRINQTVGEDISQTLVEGDIIVPDSKPDILRILQVDGNTYINDIEVEKDRVNINGTISFNVLYVADVEEDESKIKSIEINTTFSHQADINGIKDTMIANVEGDIEHIEFDIINERKFKVKAIVAIKSNVWDMVNIEVLTDVSDEKVQVLKKSIRTYNIAAQGSESFVIREQLEVPVGKASIREILKKDVKISGKEAKLINNKVILKSELDICTLYTGDVGEDVIQFMEHEIPFTEVIDIDGVNEDMYCDLNYKIQDVYFEVVEDNDGDNRFLNIEVTVNVDIKANETLELDIVSDCYSIDMNTKIDKEIYSIDEMIIAQRAQATIKEVIIMQADVPDISQVYNVITKPYISEARIEKNKVIVEGVIDAYILYLADSSDNPIYSYKQEIPFLHSIDSKDINEDMTCNVTLEITHVNYNMTSAKEVEIRCIVGMDIKVVKTIKTELISHMDFEAVDIQQLRNRPGVIIYFTQAGDTLWEIAKCYKTTIEDIASINEIQGVEELKSGQQLVIP